MEEIIKDMQRFWSEAMQTLKEVLEKGAREMVDFAREPRLPQPDVPCSQDGDSHDRCIKCKNYKKRHIL